MLAASAVLLFLAFGLLDKRSDRQLIQEALNESIRASKEGRPGSVLEYLSKSLTFNSEQAGNRQEIGKFIRASRPDVFLQNREPIVRGDTAQLVTPVRIKMSLLGASLDRTIPNVTITLSKEGATKWLIFPTARWRVTNVDAPDVNPSDFTGY